MCFGGPRQGDYGTVGDAMYVVNTVYTCNGKWHHTREIFRQRYFYRLVAGWFEVAGVLRLKSAKLTLQAL